jgi:2-C-methyl-D-erythritol 4-phosphate cytidylyltransferase/2-C-methyl-D-erythritol 2,4-cyclodiphosphate synthase
MNLHALVLAAGSARRLAGPVSKQYLPLAGKPLLRCSVEALAAHPAVSQTTVVIRDSDRDIYNRAVADLEHLTSPIIGGDERQRSALNGLEAMAPAAPDGVLIHDAARPFLSVALIDRLIRALDRAEGAIPALPVTDTLKRAHDGTVLATVPRADLWRAQTPQAFHFDAILEAHRAHADAKMTDDAAIAEAAGLSVALVAGDEDNIKVTTAADVARAERILASQRPAPLDVRVGGGFDVHRFGPGQGVIVCGIAIPHSQGLIGHSDADVGLHALTDAVLGAIGAGDIGQHFPPDDPSWAKASSDHFLAHAARLVRERGGRIAHVDLTLICEAPRLGPHRAAMIARVAEILMLHPGRVSIKATTTERLGFTGRGEGIAAQALATLHLPDDGPA